MVERLATVQGEMLAQSRLALLGEIAANVAHEVRTPLTVLKTSAQLLEDPKLPAAEQRRLASTVAAEVDRLNRVVTNLVDLARPRTVEYQTASVVDIVGRAVSFFQPVAAKLGVTVIPPFSDAELRARCSVDQLYQVLLNVIHNALQAMGGPGRLTIRCEAENEWILVEVADTGPGIPAEVLPRLFSPFCTTKSDGTGLGLAISKRIIEEHGGTIVAQNAPGDGARFQIRLPLSHQSPQHP
jgi:two-component system sensor histidine kinase HydH